MRLKVLGLGDCEMSRATFGQSPNISVVMGTLPGHQYIDLASNRLSISHPGYPPDAVGHGVLVRHKKARQLKRLYSAMAGLGVGKSNSVWLDGSFWSVI